MPQENRRRTNSNNNPRRSNRSVFQHRRNTSQNPSLRRPPHKPQKTDNE